jgi:hypothetical protein
MKSEFIRQITNQLQKRSKLWFIVWFVLFFIVPCLLILLQYIVNGINSSTILPGSSRLLFYSNTTNPRIPSLFLSNYTHIDWTHCLNNIGVYLIFVIPIFILETFWLFPMENNRTEDGFYRSLILFFLVFPFSISGVSLIIFKIIGGPEFAGFSGVVAAFLGYLWFLIYEGLFFLERYKIQQKSPQIVKIFDAFMILCFFIPILIFIIINLLSYDNLAGHTIGYVLGFFSALGMYIARKKKYDKTIIALLFTIFIWILSTFWIFF